jgi:hypothetical protein
VLAVGSIAPAAAVTSVETESIAPSTQVAVPVAESWYRPLSALCTTPVGCPPVELPAVYPDGTLHVGVLGGAPDSTTYISLPLPASGLEGGSLRLPVGPVQDGTLQPETAKVKACVVIGNVKDKIAGSWGTRPGVDCSSSAPAVPSSGGTVLTVDLTPFLTEWEGLPVGSLALVPADTPAATDLWHLAFSRHDRTGTGIQPLSASLLVQGAPYSPSPTEPEVSNPEPSTAGPLVVAPPALDPGIVPGATQPGPTVANPPVASGGTAGLRPVAAFTPDTSFAFPGVFVLPLVVLVAAGWAARAFTRDLAEEQR